MAVVPSLASPGDPVPCMVFLPAGGALVGAGWLLLVRGDERLAAAAAAAAATAGRGWWLALAAGTPSGGGAGFLRVCAGLPSCVAVRVADARSAAFRDLDAPDVGHRSVSPSALAPPFGLEGGDSSASGDMDSGDTASSGGVAGGGAAGEAGAAAAAEVA